MASSNFSYRPQEDPETLEWWSLTPAQRFVESQKLWATFLALGGSLDPSPIGKVLSTFRKHRVRALLMRGQACILYGAAEFSRDVDVAVAADDKPNDSMLSPFQSLAGSR